MYICLMPLFRWELAEVAMAEDVLGREGKTGGEGEAQRRAQRRRLSC